MCIILIIQQTPRKILNYGCPCLGILLIITSTNPYTSFRLISLLSPIWSWVNYKFTSLPKVLLMMLLLLSRSSSLLNKPSKLPLMLNTMLIWSPVTEKSPTPPTPETPTPLPRSNASRLSPTLKASLLMPSPSWLLLSRILLSLLELSKMVPPLELNKLLTTLWAKLNIKRLSMPFLKLLELLAICNQVEAGSNLKVKLKKSLKKFNLWHISPNSMFMDQWLSLLLSSPTLAEPETLFKKSSISSPSLETTSNTLKIKKLL